MLKPKGLPWKQTQTLSSSDLHQTYLKLASGLRGGYQKGAFVQIMGCYQGCLQSCIITWKHKGNYLPPKRTQKLDRFITYVKYFRIHKANEFESETSVKLLFINLIFFTMSNPPGTEPDGVCYACG